MLRWFVGAGAVACAAVFTVLFGTDYASERIDIWLHPENFSVRDETWQITQGLIAIGSGGIFGRGLGNGLQKQLYVSAPHNDFIFSVLAEETGFVGAMLLIAAYIVLIYTILRSAFLAQDSFARQSGIGIAVLIFVHLFINIGMSIGVTPITGLPLPFLSYGGSFVVSMMLALGFMQSVYRRNILSQEEDRELVN